MDQLCYVGGEKQTHSGKKLYIHMFNSDSIASELTWPYNQIWNTANFPLSQSKDLV